MSSVVFLLAFCSLAASAEKGRPRVLRETFLDDLSSQDHSVVGKAEHDAAIKACRIDGILSECMRIIEKIDNQHIPIEKTNFCQTLSSEMISYSFFNFVRLSCSYFPGTTLIPVTVINSFFVFHQDTLDDFMSGLFKGDEHSFADLIVKSLRASSGSAEVRAASAYEKVRFDSDVDAAFNKLIRIMMTLMDEVARRSEWLSHESRLVINRVNEVLNNPNHTGAEVENKIAPLLAPENRGQELTDLAQSMEIWAYLQDSCLFTPEKITNSDESLTEEGWVELARARFPAEHDAAIKACREDGVPSECMDIIEKILDSLFNTKLENTTNCPTIKSETISYFFFNFVRLSYGNNNTTFALHIPVTLINSFFVFRKDTLDDFLSRLFKGDEHSSAALFVKIMRASSGSAEKRVFDLVHSHNAEKAVRSAFKKLIHIMKTLLDEVAKRSAWLSNESRLVIKQVNEILNNPNYNGAEIQNKIAPLLALENRGQELTDLAKSMEVWAYQRDSWLFAPEIEVLPVGN